MKQIIIILFLFSLHFSLNSQPSSIFAFGIDYSAEDVENPMIKSDPDDPSYAIYHFQRGDSCFFALLLPDSLTYRSFPIPYGWRIKDYEVLNNSVYFCGWDSLQRKAIIGDYSVNNILNPFDTINYNYRFLDSSQVEWLTKIDIKDDNGVLKVATLGHYQTTAPSFIANRVFFWDDYTDTSYEMFYNPLDDGSEIDAMWDVVCTDNYVIVVGTTQYLSNTMYLRYFCSWSLDRFYASPILHQFAVNGDFQHDLKLLKVQNDSVIVASIYDDGANQDARFYYMKPSYEYDKTVYNVMSYIQRVPLRDYDGSFDATYVSDLDKIAFISSHTFVEPPDPTTFTSGDSSDIGNEIRYSRSFLRFIDPVANTAYLSDGYYYDSDKYQCGLLSASQSFVFAAGKGVWFYGDGIIVDDGNDQSCVGSNTFMSYVLPAMSDIDYKRGAYFGGLVSSFVSTKVIVSEYEINDFCIMF